jgi:hypothetical protein
MSLEGQMKKWLVMESMASELSLNMAGARLGFKVKVDRYLHKGFA